MAEDDPIAKLEPQFSTGSATPMPWPEARSQLREVEIYWLSTVRQVAPRKGFAFGKGAAFSQTRCRFAPKRSRGGISGGVLG